jgi:hypothetical protein
MKKKKLNQYREESIVYVKFPYFQEVGFVNIFYKVRIRILSVKQRLQ